MKEVFLNSENVGTLTEVYRADIADILTKRCGQRVKTRIHSILKYDLETVYNAIGLDRFYLSNNEMHYCAGQSYPCEIKAIRQAILKRFP